MTRRYPDEYLNHWSDIYVARGVKRFHITLDQFLAQPEQMLARVARFEAANARLAEPRMHLRERREDAQLCQRGPLMVLKTWQGSRKRNRCDRPFPGALR